MKENVHFKSEYWFRCMCCEVVIFGAEYFNPKQAGRFYGGEGGGGQNVPIDLKFGM